MARRTLTRVVGCNLLIYNHQPDNMTPISTLSRLRKSLEINGETLENPENLTDKGPFKLTFGTLAISPDPELSESVVNMGGSWLVRSSQ